MKNTLLIHLLYLLSIISVSAQTVEYEEDILMFHEIETPPIFEGGMSHFYDVVNQNLRSVDDKEGKVFIQFLIDTTGKMSEFEIIKGLSEKSDNEVLRLMKWINKNYTWTPRVFRGEKVNTIQVLPIIFKNENISQEKVYMVAEQPPIFEGGIDNFYKIVQKNLKFVEKPNRTGSRIFMEFVVDTTGKMTDIKVLKSSFSDVNNEGFVKMLYTLNEKYTWQPAMHKGEKVFFKIDLPIILCFLDE